MTKQSILIVEDEALVAEDIRSRMQKDGYNVVAMVADGQSAIDAYKKYSPDLIIMDVKIVGAMDGIDTAETIRKKHDVPIVFLTAYEDVVTSKRAKKVAAYGCLHKPFETNDLYFMVETALLRHGLEQELKYVNMELENRVQERTAELLELNRRLLFEIQEHESTENELFITHKELAEKAKEVKEFSHKLIKIRETEQKRVANDLHDEIGAFVVGVTSKLSIAEADIRDGNLDGAQQSIVTTKVAVRKGVEDLKKIAISLRPPNLDIIGLKGALEFCFMAMKDRASIKVNSFIDIREDLLNDDIAIVIYRVAQELVTNVLKHAKAKTVDIELLIEKGKLIFKLMDDGRGFDEITAKELLISNRIGIIGMRERIESIGGFFKIESKKNNGTSIFVSIPL